MNIVYGIRYYFYSLLFARDKLYFLKRFANKIVKRDYPDKTHIIYYSQLRMWLAVPPLCLYDLPRYEPKVVSALRGLIKTGVTFVDVGAFIGFYSLLAAKLGAKVIALEPDIRSFMFLLHNVKLSKLEEKVTAINLAAGAHEGSLKLKLADDLSQTSATDYLTDNTVIGVVEVPMVTVDNVVRSQGIDRIDMMKVDVEGAGLGVVKGARLTIKEYKPRIIFEVHKNSTCDELMAVKLLTEEFNYDYKILEIRNRRNFIILLTAA